MGKKKRTSLVNPPPSPADTTVDAASDQDILTIDDHPALCAIRRGNYKKALEMIKPPLLSSQPHSPILHCIAAVTHRHLAAKATQGSHKEFKHLTEAARSAESAWEVFPNSIQVASVLVSLLYRLAKWDDTRWDKVIQVCNQALNIENSTDPRILNKLLDKYETTNVKQRIKNLLLDSGHKKNLSLAKTKRVEEVNKEVKEREENVLLKEDLIRPKRIEKQIEEILNAPRQTTSYNCHVKKLIDNFEKQGILKRFWGSTLKAEKKRVFLQVKIEELERYLKSLKFHRAVELLDEALRFAKEHKTWKFLECCDCSEKFVDHDLYRGHCRMPNLGAFESSFQSLIKDEIDSEWINMIVNCVWKPVDTDVAIRMMGSTVDGSLCTEKDLGECKDSSVEDVQETISEEESVQDLAGRKKDENVSSKTSMNDPKWPICDDPKREGILERIRGIFLFLLNNNFLSLSLVHWAIQYTIHEFDDNILSSKFRCHGLESPEIIRFLGASKLEELHNFLKGLACSFDLSEDSEIHRSMDVGFSGHQVLDIKEEVVFSVDFSCLLLDERLLTGELNISNYFDAVANDGSAVTDAVDVGVNRYNFLSDGSEIVPWLCQQPRHRIEANIKSWSSLIDSQKAKAKEVLGIVLEECAHLQTAANRICKLLIEMEATPAVNNGCLEDSKNREAKMRLFKDMAFADSIILRFINVLRKSKLILEKLSAVDYRAIIVPLLKLYLQTHLEDLLDEDAKENFGATDEDLLASIESDAVKNTNKGSDKVRQKQYFQLLQDDAEKDDSPSFEVHVSLTTAHDSGSTFGVGLKNDAGENNCFLNVIIQSLWHLRGFQTHFMNRLKLHNEHVRDQCLVCALYDTFDQLSKASRNNQREAVSPTILRNALSYLYPNKFKRIEMHDAAEVLDAILFSLHESFTSGLDYPHCALIENCNDPSEACLVHKIFGMKTMVEILWAKPCHKQIHMSETVHLNTYNIRKEKIIHGKVSFDDTVTIALQNTAKMRVQGFFGDSDAAHCGELNQTHVIDLVPLQVLNVVLDWTANSESQENIMETLNSLSTKLNIGDQGSHRGKEYILISMICYLGDQMRYYCFIYQHECQRCVLYNDEHVEDVGCWVDVFDRCKQNCLQPLVLTFENTQLEDLFERATGDVEHIQLQKNNAEQDDSRNTEIDISLTAAHDEIKPLDEYVGNRRSTENKANKKCNAENNKEMSGSIGKNLEEKVMGKKRCSSSSCVKKPPIPSPSKQSTTVVNESLDPVIKSQAMKARDTLESGDSKKALKMITKSITSHQDSPHLLCVKAAVLLSLAMEASKGKYHYKQHEHLAEATCLTERALALLPNSLFIASFHAFIRFYLAEINEEWDEVIKACKASLKIENTTDPRIDDLWNEDKMAHVCKESRIDTLKQKAMKVLQDSECRKNCGLFAKEAVEHCKREIVDVIKEHFMGVERRKKQIAEIISEPKQETGYYCMEKFNENTTKSVKYGEFWSSELTAKEKMVFGKVNIEELGRHLKSLQNDFAVELLGEAVGFSKKYKTWKFIQCCVCLEKFGDQKLYRNHFRRLHLHKFESTLQSVMQRDAESKWIEMIQNGVWEPVDSSLCTEKGLGECIDSSFEDVQGKIGEEERVQDLVGTKSDENVSSKTSEDDQKGPLCEDDKRAEILKEIHGTFFLLLKSEFLTSKLVCWVEQYIFHESENIIQLENLRCDGLETLKVICSLRASQLKELRNFLQDLTFIVGLSGNSEMSRPLDDKLIRHRGLDFKERVGFSEDFSFLLLDERLLTGELNITNYYDAVADNGSAATFTVDVSPENVEIVSWLYLCCSIGEILDLWTSIRDSQKGKSVKVLKKIFEESWHFETACQRISQLWNMMEAIQSVNSIFLEETKSREPYSKLLNKRRKDLQESDDNASKIESDFISDILNEATAVLAQDQSGSKEGLTVEEISKQVDNCIKLAMWRLKKQLLKDMAFLNALTLRHYDALRNYEMILENLSAYDYRSIIVPSLKSFLQAHMENLFTKKNSDAILREIDAEKNKYKDCDIVREKQDKKKNKKKKYFRKYKKSKATNCGEHFQLHQNDAEQIDSRNSETEREGKQLEEKLQKQRQFENDAKKRLLAKRFQAEVERAICLSLDCFEKHHGQLPTDVRNGSTPRFDVHQYAIIQSQWHLRKLRDKSMSRSEICNMHMHAGNPCFLCACRDSFAALNIASRDIPEVAVVPISLRKFPVKHIFEEWLNSEDLVNEGVKDIGVSKGAYELKQELVALVKKIVEELEDERKTENEAKQEEDLAEHNAVDGKPAPTENVTKRNV